MDRVPQVKPLDLSLPPVETLASARDDDRRGRTGTARVEVLCQRLG